MSPLAPSFLPCFGGFAATRVFSDVAPWLAALVVIVVIGGVALGVLRKRMRRREDAPSGGFTLHDLRQLHAGGELTDEEFERARQAIIDRVRGREAPPGDEPENEPFSNEFGTDGR